MNNNYSEEKYMDFQIELVLSWFKENERKTGDYISISHISGKKDFDTGNAIAIFEEMVQRRLVEKIENEMKWRLTQQGYKKING